MYEFRRLQAYWMQFVQQLVKESSPTRQSVVWEEAFTDAKEIPLLNGNTDARLHVTVTYTINPTIVLYLLNRYHYPCMDEPSIITSCDRGR